MRWTVGIVLAVSGVAIGAGLRSERAVQQDDGALSLLEARIAELESRPAEAAARTVVIERAAPPPAVSGPEVESPDEEPPDPPLTDEALHLAMEEARLEREAERERITALIEAEPRDAEWADATELAVRTSIADRAREHADVTAVDCRSRYCRIEMSHRDVEGQQAAMYGVAGSPGFRLPGRAHLEYDDQKVTTYVFLARYGDFFVEP